MNKISTTFFVFFVIFNLSSLNGKAQAYVWEKTTGAQPYTGNIRPNGVLIMKGPADSVMSEWQEIPFEFYFYGKLVTGYYVSDNGYITFSADEKESMTKNTELPSVNAPKNAIFAYWNDLELAGGQPAWSNEIRTITIGDAPSRHHVIMWVSPVPRGGSPSNSSLSFAIVLSEGGDFSIVYIAGRKPFRLYGTIGYQNEDGTRGGMLEDSPNFDFPSLTAAADDDITYSFEFSDFDYDMTVTSSNLPKTAKNDSEHIIQVIVKNLGNQTINSFDLNLKAESGAVITQSVGSVSLRTNEMHEITMESAFKFENPGEFTNFKIWCDNINNQYIDQSHRNDTLREKVFVNLGKSGKRKVMVEEYTGAWCGWCPDGLLQLKKIEDTIEDVTLIAIHAGSGADNMKIQKGMELAATYQVAFPQATVDRYKFSDENNIALNRTNDNWLVKTQRRLLEPTPIDIIMHTTYNETEREIDLKVELQIVDYPYPGDIRLNICLVEDNLRGEGIGWDQANYYSNNQSFPNHPFYSQANPIKGFIHRHVLRQALTGTWGMNIAQGTMQAGSSYNDNFVFNLPANFNEHGIYLVAYVSYFNSDQEKREIINSQSTKLTTGSSVKSDIADETFTIYPNPSSDFLFIKNHSNMITKGYTIYDNLGNIVDKNAGPNNSVNIIDISKLATGVYTLRLDTGNGLYVKRFNVIK